MTVMWLSSEELSLSDESSREFTAGSATSKQFVYTTIQKLSRR